MLRLYNTKTRKKQVFKPQKGKTVRLYSCGPTVYDYVHIGNLRAYLFVDVLKRVLVWNTYRVRHVMNVTDVGHLVSDADSGEDKLVLGAKREHKSAWDVAAFYINAFKKDIKRLRIIEPRRWVRATDHISDMITLIKKMEKKGYTYQIEDGIYFDSSMFRQYAAFAGLDTKGLKAGARVAMTQGKKHPTDFALWKFSPKHQKRDMEWESPWGKGFPGWHIECSAMAMKYLGNTLDMHTGGVDHIPIHHTNEIAQSESVTGKPFARFWLHNEFMSVDGKKMAKSLGNYYILQNIIEKGYPPLAFRYLCLSVHYRSQMNFTFEALKDAEQTVKNINDFVTRIRTNGIKTKTNKTITTKLAQTKKRVEKEINNDLNTPQALAAFFDLMKTVNKEIDKDRADTKSLQIVYEYVMELNTIFDIIEQEQVTLTDEEKKLVLLREEFRAQKDFKAADEIREQLKEKGVLLEDSPQGVRWKKQKKEE